MADKTTGSTGSSNENEGSQIDVTNTEDYPVDGSSSSSSSSSAAAAAAAASVSVHHQPHDDDEFIAQKFHAIEQLYNVFGFSYSVAQQAVDYITESDATATNKSGTTGNSSNNPTIDITACYNYIFDHGLGQDKGGPVTPTDTCPHILNHCQISVQQLPIQPSNVTCSYIRPTPTTTSTTTGTTSGTSSDLQPKGHLKSDIDYMDDHHAMDGTTTDTTSSACQAKENWLCLQCGVIRCSRYCYGHAMQHWEDTTTTNEHKEEETEGHCCAISLSDFSIWCHICQSYISTQNRHSTGYIVQPILQQLEHYKFHIESEKEETKKDECSTYNYEDPNSMHTTTATTTTTTTMGTDNTDTDHLNDNKDDQDPDEQRNNKKVKVDPNMNCNEDDEDEELDDGDHDEDDQDEDGHDEEEDDDEDGHDEEEDDDDNDDSQRQDLLRKLIVIAEERGIPLEWLIAQANQMTGIFDNVDDDDDDDEPVVYKFDHFPTSIQDVAKFILSDQCTNIVILAGAGMSVGSGIPDFRSADGLYATLNPQLLTANEEEQEAIRADPTISLDQHMFLQNPLPCLELQREFILGTQEQRWKATIAHRFVELLHTKTNKLVRHYTQNIDGLEDQCTKLPNEKVIAVHGSMDRAECARCNSESDFNDFCTKVRNQIKDLSGNDPMAPHRSTPIECNVCGYTSMKPAIVLFRSSLPKTFAQNVPNDVQDVDLLIVIGTSLRVAPANSIVRQVPNSAMRVLVNRETAGGHLGMIFDEHDPTRDYFAQGECDAIFLELMDSLGWIDDLEYLIPNKLLPDSSAALLKEFLEQRRQRNRTASS